MLEKLTLKANVADQRKWIGVSSAGNGSDTIEEGRVEGVSRVHGFLTG